MRLFKSGRGSAWLERLVRDQEVGGSNPLAPTKFLCAMPPASILDRVPVSEAALRQFCERWKISTLELFGSVLRDDFTPDSDVDVLVSFAPEAEWSLFDHLAMEDELGLILKRKVDLVSRRAVESSSNWIRRQAILGSAEPYFVAR